MYYVYVVQYKSILRRRFVYSQYINPKCRICGKINSKQLILLTIASIGDREVELKILELLRYIQNLFLCNRFSIEY